MMLVVRLEIHPGGDASRAREIGRAEIGNLSELAPVSDYEYRLIGDAGGGSGVVNAHRRADGAWELVRRMLQDQWRPF